MKKFDKYELIKKLNKTPIGQTRAFQVQVLAELQNRQKKEQKQWQKEQTKTN